MDFAEVNYTQSYLIEFLIDLSEQLAMNFVVLGVSLPVTFSLDAMPNARVQVDVVTSLGFAVLAPTIVIRKYALLAAVANHTVTLDMALSGLR